MAQDTENSQRDQRHLISELEAEIDALREAAERCRKIDTGAKASIGMGAAVLLVGFLWLKPLFLVVGIGLILGSVALLGSNRGSLGEINARIRVAETHRAKMIDNLELEAVVQLCGRTS